MNDKDKLKEFELLVKPLINWLNKYANPHTQISIGVDFAEISIGTHVVKTDEFIRD